MTKDTGAGSSYEAPAILAEDLVLLPEMEMLMSVKDSKNIAAASQAVKEHSLAVLVPSNDTGSLVGSIGTLVHMRKLLQGVQEVQSDARGLWRVRIDGVLADDPYVRLRFSRAEEVEDQRSRSPMMTAVTSQIDEFARLLPELPSEIISMLKGIDSPGKLADFCGYSPFFTNEDRLDLLTTLDPEARLGKVRMLFDRQLEELKRLAQAKSILECPTCIEMADRAFEMGPEAASKVAHEFLDHVTREHPDEVLGVLAERYGPAFLKRRALK
jgi:ATP-dependent Lon protease